MLTLGTARLAPAVVWYENQRTDRAVTWKKHFIDSESLCPTHGNPADMDGDGDLDVVMALGFYYRPGSDDPKASLKAEDNQIVWYGAMTATFAGAAACRCRAGG